MRKRVGLSGRLVDMAAALLDPAEREVVRGDLAETGASNTRVLSEILGLVVRRQAGFWADWQPWAALFLVVVPLGLLLSLMSRLWADGTSVDVWVYGGHWDWGFLRYPGLRADVVRVMAVTIRQYVLLVCWAWTTGFAIGSLSRRTAWLNGVLFFAVVFAGTTGSTTVMRNDPRVFSWFVAAVVMPLSVKTIVVIVPAFFGMRWALRNHAPSMRAAFIWTVALAFITFIDARAVEMSAGYSGWKPFGPLPNPGPDHSLGTDDDIIDWRLRLLPLVVMWPAIYLLATTTMDRFRRRT